MTNTGEGRMRNSGALGHAGTVPPIDPAGSTYGAGKGVQHVTYDENGPEEDREHHDGQTEYMEQVDKRMGEDGQTFLITA